MPRISIIPLLLGAAAVAGCGTTRWTDTSRTGTEQLLISDAIDRAVSQIRFQPLAGRTVFLDTSYLKLTNPVYNFDDNHYLVSSLRQHLLASGCLLKDKREDAEFIVEARAGAVGTDRNDLLYGVPATNLGAAVPVQGVPTAIPEIPLAKRTVQRGVCKVAVFAYHRESGQPVWQSGANQVASNARNTWLFGIGPFQSGTIYDRTEFAGRTIPNPLAGDGNADERPLWVTKEAHFNDPRKLVEAKPQTTPDAKPVAAAAGQATSPGPTAVQTATGSPATPTATTQPAAFQNGPPPAQLHSPAASASSSEPTSPASSAGGPATILPPATAPHRAARLWPH